MNKRRMAVLAFFAVALAIPALSAAAPSASAEVTQIRLPISFTIPAGQCPDLTVSVEGTGEGFTLINDRVDKDGVHHIIMNTLTTGTATDSEGATYLFNYHNHASVDIPPGGFPFSIQSTDHFNLIGEGKAKSMHVGFVVRATFNSPSDPGTIEFVNTRGNPFFCDPI